MNRNLRKFFAGVLLASCLTTAFYVPAIAKEKDEPVVLRICNWEEYIDEGDWDEEETIDLESGDIIGENSVVDDFTQWYEETYGKKVEVEYSCFGTNEELYSQLTLGDVYDLVCPSEYMIMKLMSEEKVEPLSEHFFDENDENNYYVRGVSQYIKNIFDTQKINGEPMSKYSAGYMWGITGFIYNPDYVEEEDAKTWNLLCNKDYFRQVTIKDNVRDAYFPTLGIINKEKLLSEELRNDEDYSGKLTEIMNDTSSETMKIAEDKLRDIRNNVYSFETDSGKADMVSGKIVANLQWSGDGVFIMDQADEEDTYLCWAVPDECTNMWSDGWVMLKDGIGDDAEKKHAAEAFLNFISRPDIAIRNMYYIGYTSVIAGGEDERIFEYADWNYGAEEDEEDTIEYPIGYFFSGEDDDEDYVITAPADALRRQLAAQYPSKEVFDRSAMMEYFDEEANAAINQMWINIRCFSLKQISVIGWIAIGGVVIAVIAAILISFYFRRKGVEIENAANSEEKTYD